MNTITPEVLRATWRELARRNNWQLVVDEDAFLAEAVEEYNTLTRNSRPPDPEGLALRRIYGARLYQGIQQSLDRAFRELGMAFLRFARAHGCSVSEAQELAQQCVVVVWEKRGDLRDPKSFLAWAPMIFRTQRQRHRQRQQREIQFIAADELDDELDDDELDDAVVKIVDPKDSIAEVEGAILDADLRALLRSKIPNARDWLILLRTVLLGEKPQDVARDLGMTSAALRMSKVRIKKRLLGDPDLLREIESVWVGGQEPAQGSIGDDI